ncbi:MAG: hypothetical protein MJ196_06205 [Treponemataceae bacterium]|nr:hypothetical protein [Treponemataceae bacterium]
MTDEEKAKEYANIHIDSEWDRKQIEQAYLDGLTEGRKETKTEWKNCFLSCSSPYCRKYFENVAIEGCLGNMSKREQ